MKLTFEALLTIDAIDRLGSFAAAAAELGKAPTAITYAIRKLEEDLDVLLYDRRGHRAKLTDAGQELLAQGRHLLKSAHALEHQVKRAATGWEVELRIVIDSVIQFDRLLPLIQEFENQACGTRLRISQEVLSGVWEALALGRADLALGAAYDGPNIIRMQGEYQTRLLGNIDFAYVVAPTHPLANAAEPLTPTVIQAHRAVSVGDTGRHFPAMTVGLLSGQDTITVPTVHAKLLAQLAGLGGGHLPRSLISPYLKNGQLVEKITEGIRPDGSNRYAWRSTNKGRALQWFLKRLADPAVQRALIS